MNFFNLFTKTNFAITIINRKRRLQIEIKEKQLIENFFFRCDTQDTEIGPKKKDKSVSKTPVEKGTPKSPS